MRRIEHHQNMLDRTRREFRRKYCLHPKAPKECSRKIAHAHSVQRAILEKFIAEKGHVVQIKISSHVDEEQHLFGLLAKPEFVGVNKATTFSGFCAKHDAALFRVLETKSFSFRSDQIARLGYRAVSRELYAKDAEIAAADAMRTYVSVNPDIPGFAEKDERHQIMHLARINARMNLVATKDRYWTMLTDQGALRYYGVTFEQAPMYLNSVAFLPEWDFEGRRLQNVGFIADYLPICFSAWAAEDRAAIVFSWHESADQVCLPFIDSARRIPPQRLADRILSMAMEVSDNVVFRHDWWESISEADRQRLVLRAYSGMPDSDRKSDCLADDGLNALASSVRQEHIGY